MIDNFSQIQESVLDFSCSDDFYVCMVLRRGKDHGDKLTYTAREWVISNSGRLEELNDEIISTCERHGARAYLDPSPKSWKKTTFTMAHNLLERIRLEDFKYVHRAWLSSATKSPGSFKKWVVDVDEDMKDRVLEIKNEILSLKPNQNSVLIVPTVHGFHLLANPFDSKSFNDRFPNVEIKKDSPTLLYVPDFK